MSDKNTNVDCSDQIEKLKKIAADWRKSPHLSNDYGEGMRYGELIDEIKDKCGDSYVIRAYPEGSTNYQVALL